jgi:predicted nucleic acid-binding protein
LPLIAAEAEAGYSSVITRHGKPMASQLRVQYRLKLPDAVQLASALTIEAAALVTHDRDFAKVEGLPVVSGATA